MFWQDQAIVVRKNPFSEQQWLVTLLTHNHGLCKGLVTNQGAFSGWILGSQTDVSWESASDNGLGRLTMDPAYGPAPLFMHIPHALCAVNMMCLLCGSLLPERVSMPSIYIAFLKTLSFLPTEKGLRAYNDFESHFLEELGYGQSHPWEKKTLLETLFHRRHVFRQYWPDHQYLDRQRVSFLNDLRNAFQQTKKERVR